MCFGAYFNHIELPPWSANVCSAGNMTLYMKVSVASKVAVVGDLGTLTNHENALGNQNL